MGIKVLVKQLLCSHEMHLGKNGAYCSKCGYLPYPVSYKGKHEESTIVDDARERSIGTTDLDRNPYVANLQEAITKFLKAEGEWHSYTEYCVPKDDVTARVVSRYNDAVHNLIDVCSKAGSRLTTVVPDTRKGVQKG